MSHVSVILADAAASGMNGTFKISAACPSGMQQHQHLGCCQLARILQKMGVQVKLQGKLPELAGREVA